jgi:hypothetical protein
LVIAEDEFKRLAQHTTSGVNLFQRHLDTKLVRPRKRSETLVVVDLTNLDRVFRKCRQANRSNRSCADKALQKCLSFHVCSSLSLGPTVAALVVLHKGRM